MNYYDRFPGDYRRKTAHLDLARHGAYTLLLDTQYSTEAGLPADLDSLYRICSAMTKAEREAVRAVADEFFPVRDDGLRWNDRALEDIPRAQRRIAASRTNGKGGGRPKKNPPGDETETHDKPAGLSPGTPPETHAGEAFPHTPYPNPFGGGGSEPRSEDGPAMPHGLSPATWRSWKQHLLAIGKPMTPQSEGLNLARLAGHADPEAVVRKAIASGHRNLEPVGGWPKDARREDKREATKAAIWSSDDDRQPQPSEHDITGQAVRVG